MKFNVNNSLSYGVNGPTTFIFNIQALHTNNQRLLEEKLEIEPQINFEQYTSHDGNSRFIRLKVKQPTNFTLTYSAVVKMNYTIFDESDSDKTVLVVELDSYIASFLCPSRYCQSDQLMKFSFK